jgi:hypothetical protein
MPSYAFSDSLAVWPKAKMHRSNVMMKTANNTRFFLQILILTQFASMLIAPLSLWSEGSFFAYV